jgi:hypothetical protein
MQVSVFVCLDDADKCRDSRSGVVAEITEGKDRLHTKAPPGRIIELQQFDKSRDGNRVASTNGPQGGCGNSASLGVRIMSEDCHKLRDGTAPVRRNCCQRFNAPESYPRTSVAESSHQRDFCSPGWWADLGQSGGRSETNLLVLVFHQGGSECFD